MPKDKGGSNGAMLSYRINSLGKATAIRDCKSLIKLPGLELENINNQNPEAYSLLVSVCFIPQSHLMHLSPEPVN